MNSNNSSLQRFSSSRTIYKVVIYQLILLLVIYQCSRLLFFIFNHSYFHIENISQYNAIIFYSIRFDISTVLTINLPYLILSLLPFSFISNKWYVSMLNGLFILSNSLALLFDLGDIGYYPYVRKRMTAEVFDLIGKKSDFIDLLPSYIKEFWFVPVMMIIFMIGFIFLNSKIRRIYSGNDTGHFNLKSSLLFLLMVAISVLAIRGGFQLKPIMPVNALMVASNENTALVINTPFSIIHTFEEEKLKRISFYTDVEAGNYFQLKKEYEFGLSGDCNVVLIILESFGKGYTGIGGRKSYTPCLDSLMNKGMVFTNAYANAFRSSDGIPACIAGIPHFMEEAFTTSPYAGNKIDALPSLLKKIGYSSSFYHGGTNGTMSFDIFAKSAGFDKYVGRTEYKNDNDYDGTWGIWDEPFLQFYATELKKEKQPFFSTVFTLSSHEPFPLPKQYKNTGLAKLQGIYRGITYTDMALCKFFETASKQAWYKNTLFVITADHNFLANNDTLGFYNNGMGLYSIPVVLYNPSDAGLHGIYPKLFQQIDILPTVLNYVRYPMYFFAFGNSAFDTSNKRFAYNMMNGYDQFLIDDYLLTANDANPTGIYNYKTDSLLKNKLANDSLMQHYSAYYMAFKQLLNNSILDNKQSLD